VQFATRLRLPPREAPILQTPRVIAKSVSA
jgi:hypothetical protein